MHDRAPQPLGYDQTQPYQRPNFEDLSPEQQAAILSGPGWVTDPVTLQQWENSDDFKATNPTGSDNFFGFFAAQPGSLLKMAHDQTQAFQRFSILYPEATAYLTERATAIPHAAAYPDELWEELRQAYIVMAQLVDRQDPRVITDAGEVDMLYLTR